MPNALPLPWPAPGVAAHEKDPLHFQRSVSAKIITITHKGILYSRSCNAIKILSACLCFGSPEGGPCNLLLDSVRAGVDVAENSAP